MGLLEGESFLNTL